MGGWLVLGHYTRRQHVMGTLVPHAGVITATARTAGQITYVATEGKHVKAGEIIASVSGEYSSALNRPTFKEIRRQLDDEEGNIRRQIDVVLDLSAAQARDYRNQQAYLQKQLVKLTESRELVNKQADAIRLMLKREAALVNKGYISQIQIQQQQAQLAGLEIEKKNLERQKYELSRQLDESRSQTEQLPLTARQRTEELRRQLSQLEEARVQNDGARTTVAIAPIDGVVAAPLVKRAQTVAAGQALVSMIPENASLQAQFFVPSTAIGFIKPGTPVSLHMLAYPYQKFGAVTGIVKSISRRALSPAEVSTALGGPLPSMGQYRLIIELRRQTMTVYGKRAALKPGMECEADILLDRRSFFDWLLEPIEGMRNK